VLQPKASARAGTVEDACAAEFSAQGTFKSLGFKALVKSPCQQPAI